MKKIKLINFFGILSILMLFKVIVDIFRPSNPISIDQDLILKNEIIATCYKNIETGPRALGHRSMICNAHSILAVKQLNEKIKKRSKFRPVAPAIDGDIVTGWHIGGPKE